MRPCRDALESDGFTWKDRSGALIFVHPPQHRAVMWKLVDMKIELKPSHIMFAQSLERLVDEALHACNGVCKKGRKSFSVDASFSDGASAGSSLPDECYQVVVQHTFICVVPHDGDDSC